VTAVVGSFVALFFVTISTVIVIVLRAASTRGHPFPVAPCEDPNCPCSPRYKACTCPRAITLDPKCPRHGGEFKTCTCESVNSDAGAGSDFHAARLRWNAECPRHGTKCPRGCGATPGSPGAHHLNDCPEYRRRELR